MPPDGHGSVVNSLADEIDITDLASSAMLACMGTAIQFILSLNDGVHSTSMTMMGDFSQSNIVIKSDSHTGSSITYT